ncbi:hypothetical protein G6F68_016305 [Rhizopus microsporus]|nr:hypothetical protein G6F68_016305 [Rhizopus microsporus]
MRSATPIFDEGIDGDALVQQVGAVAQAGIAGCVDAVAGRLQAIRYRAPAPAAVPRTMREHIGLGLLGRRGGKRRRPRRQGGQPGGQFQQGSAGNHRHCITPAPAPVPGRRSGRRCVRCR